MHLRSILGSHIYMYIYIYICIYIYLLIFILDFAIFGNPGRVLYGGARRFLIGLVERGLAFKICVFLVIEAQCLSLHRL